MSNVMIRGRVHKFGDNINTDLISPAHYVGNAPEVMIAHAMEGADPDFARNVCSGDILVAGSNFGSGSSRETAPFVIKGSGIQVVIAKFFARIFYRNAINIGLPVLICTETDRIDAGDELEVYPSSGIIKNLTKSEEYAASKLPDNIMQIVSDGGLIPHLQKRTT